jgi:hypothetical protein
MIIHATGPKGEYVLEIKDNYDPTTSTRLAKEVRVGSLRTPMTKAQLAALLYQTPIKNRNREFDCQK